MASETLTNFTYDELLKMPDDGLHYEIIDGELVVNAAPNLRDQTIVVNLTLILGSYVRARRCGKIFTSPVDVVFTQKWVAEPDIIYISKERASIMAKTHVSGAPDLAVEVLSSSTRKKDEITKRQAYEQFGVAEYWIIDPARESVKINRRDTADEFESPLFPGLTIALTDVFAE